MSPINGIQWAHPRVSPLLTMDCWANKIVSFTEVMSWTRINSFSDALGQYDNLRLTIKGFQTLALTKTREQSERCRTNIITNTKHSHFSQFIQQSRVNNHWLNYFDQHSWTHKPFGRDLHKSWRISVTRTARQLTPGKLGFDDVVSNQLNGWIFSVFIKPPRPAQ
jgi:hypothetical protein